VRIFREPTAKMLVYGRRRMGSVGGVRCWDHGRGRRVFGLAARRGYRL